LFLITLEHEYLCVGIVLCVFDLVFKGCVMTYAFQRVCTNELVK